ncbi:uncharacterized protein FOMMEDRAFT_38421, partial [Fomitiporia mediterranea MF3/22]|uniref:uncharacterized protein n=1 Tax=Fomitiporia mediterranea (strain MF3/22) TaxID=694068 RepID=UPI0004409291
RCFSNTCTKYLERVKSWLLSPMTDKNILWLNGIAGSGKSTIAASIMDYCDSTSRLAAFVFFVRAKNEYGSIIRTIAYQLAEFNPDLSSCITTAAEKLRDITGSTFMTQFKTLL